MEFIFGYRNITPSTEKINIFNYNSLMNNSDSEFNYEDYKNKNLNILVFEIFDLDIKNEKKVYEMIQKIERYSKDNYIEMVYIVFKIGLYSLPNTNIFKHIKEFLNEKSINLVHIFDKKECFYICTNSIFDKRNQLFCLKTGLNLIKLNS